MRTSIILNIIKNHVFFYRYDKHAASVQMQNYVIFHFKHFNMIEIVCGDIVCGRLEFSAHCLAVWHHSFGNDDYYEDDTYKHLPLYFKKEYLGQKKRS